MNKSNRGIILAYELGYKVTENGEVYNPKGMKMKVSSNKNTRYPQISFKHSGEGYCVRMHRLAAYCFYGQNIFNDRILVRHLNDDKTDLSKNNIVLGTQVDNMADISEEKQAEMSVKKREYALANNIKPPRNVKISDEEVVNIMHLLASGLSQREVAKRYKVHHSTINYIDKKRGRKFDDRTTED